MHLSRVRLAHSKRSKERTTRSTLLLLSVPTLPRLSGLTKGQNEDLNVYTKNRRNIVLLAHDRKNDTPLNIACINVGAMLVGSIIETVKQGDQVKRGDCTGYFQYGGSTVLVLFPPGAVKWDEDLVVNSKKGLETAVRVGERIGVLV